MPSPTPAWWPPGRPLPPPSLPELDEGRGARIGAGPPGMHAVEAEPAGLRMDVDAGDPGEARAGGFVSAEVAPARVHHVEAASVPGQAVEPGAVSRSLRRAAVT